MPEWMIDFLAYELRVWEDEAIKKEEEQNEFVRDQRRAGTIRV